MCLILGITITFYTTDLEMVFHKILLEKNEPNEFYITIGIHIADNI